jgi:hypothetical protein
MDFTAMFRDCIRLVEREPLPEISPPISREDFIRAVAQLMESTPSYEGIFLDEAPHPTVWWSQIADPRSWGCDCDICRPPTPDGVAADAVSVVDPVVVAEPTPERPKKPWDQFLRETNALLAEQRARKR